MQFFLERVRSNRKRDGFNRVGHGRCKIDETVSFETGLNCLSYLYLFNNRGDERHPPTTASELVAFELGRCLVQISHSQFHLRGNA